MQITDMHRPDPHRPTVTGVVLTYNDAIHIERCLESLKAVSTRLVVVDSFSSDETVAIAKSMGADVLLHPFESHAAQYQWAFDNSGIDTDWLLSLDSDEYLEPGLALQINDEIASLPVTVSAIEMKRKVFFEGRWIRWGGHYDTILTRMWRVGAAHVEQRWMDPQVVVDHGESVRFAKGDIVDDNLKGVTAWTDKHNSYTSRQAVDFLAMEYPLFDRRAFEGKGLNKGAAVKRYLRNGVYARAPLYWRALFYYLYRYLVRLGFLDGRAGFAFHSLQGFWNFLLVDVKIAEFRHYIEQNGLPAFRRLLLEQNKINLPQPAELEGDNRTPAQGG